MAQTDLCVIGGGVSGMTSAIAAARAGLRVIIIEHNDRVGKKILATGNGRCNLSNARIGRSDYDGENPDFAMKILSRCTAVETLEFLHGIGVPTVEENERIYPRTFAASTVLDALRFELARRNIRVLTQEEAEEVCRTREGFSLHLKSGAQVDAKTLLFAPGGLAAPKTGSDGSANPLIRSLGHTIVPQIPALTALVTDAPYRKALSGLRVNGMLRLYEDENFLREESGQIQFTDYGLSGIPVFQLSAIASRVLSGGSGMRMVLDFLPDQSAAQTQEELYARIHSFGSQESISDLLNGFLPKKLLTELCRLCGIRMSQTYEELRRQIRNSGGRTEPMPEPFFRLAHLSKNLVQNVTGTKGFDMAQTTAGGVPAYQLKETMESALVPGLFFAGEIVDVHGRCGGYNLQWAFSSGLLAGKCAAEYCR